MSEVDSMEYKPIKIKVPFEFVGMDLIGKLVKTDQNNQYICVIIDYCTRAFSKLVDEKPNNWDVYLDAVMFGLCTKRQLTTQFSPFFLMFGREARYPAEVPENYQVDGSFEDVLAEEEVAIDIESHDKIMNIVQENMKGVQERTRKRLQSNIPQQNLKVGDVVLRRNIRSQQRKGGKLDPEFLGPFSVTRIDGKSIDLVDSNGKPIQKANIDHLKLYHEQTPRIPKKLKGHPEVCSISTPPQSPVTVTLAFMRKRGCEVSTWSSETVPHSRQKDATSCGVFVLKMISKSYATTVEKKMCTMKKANVGNKGKDKTALQSG
ncbi:hypothetical protein SRHO_G00235710 [Serrasalmus rhombeus]